MIDITAPKHKFGENSVRAIFPKLVWIALCDSFEFSNRHGKAIAADWTQPIQYKIYRPFIHSSGTYWMLEQDRHDWLAEQRIEYGLRQVPSELGFSTCWEIGFRQKSEAAKFKLAWI